ncbi:Protoheme IX farnesyltransferase, mitochondrial [Bacidia gigantensis]|uniref:Protoheme IX farnesyltransferase, mitochondrial n=1 Tax=Bacidia gigantensis TaxID=2732470 RepID=UPI001D03AAF1|nr:Protoheme IX farnesyltransferase, mitochondrial [Bacidia gigantensis]KAG8533082.1 Protoheme IX farnesyltransferase, mitochondrial [Bacidia gigantensis]
MFPVSRVVQPIPRFSQTICLGCLARLTRLPGSRRLLSISTANGAPIGSNVGFSRQWRREYFSANLPKTLRDALILARTRETDIQESQLENGYRKENAPHDTRISRVGGARTIQAPQTSKSQIQQPEDSVSQTPEFEASEPPHRRRARRRALESSSNHEQTTQFLPSNSASNLTTLSTALPNNSIRRLLTTCLSLSKPRLSVLVVLTTAASYSLYPVPALLSPETIGVSSLSTLTLLFLTTGTGLCSASANALNMLLEPKYDALMSRTRNRPLVRGLISKRAALIFALVAGTMGVGGLWAGCNPTVAFLGGLNIVLYAGAYTPLKRISVINTWVGAVVGSIPPLMGWAAAAGQSATAGGGWKEILFSESSIGGWLLAGLLFCWQFPHFNSLSWAIREEYKQAGYRMLCWTNPAKNGRVAFRYAVLCFPVCIGLWATEITDQGFLVTSSVVNAWMAREAWRFWRLDGLKGSARGLFWASVWHLPVVMVLAMVHKQGLWEGLWKRMVGNGNVDQNLELEDEASDIPIE